jgi:hypothetical protein
LSLTYATTFLSKSIFMKLLISLISIILHISLNSCTDSIDNFKFKDIDPKIVIHGAINEKDNISVNISRSLSLNEPAKYIPLENANIKLLRRNEIVANFSRDSSGWYSVKDYKQLINTKYTIVAECNGFNPASIDFIIPEKQNIAMVSWEKLFESAGGGSQTTFIDITITIDDNPTTIDYYTIDMRGEILSLIYYYDGLPSYNNADEYDSVDAQYSKTGIPIYSSDKSVKISKNYSSYTLFDPRNGIMLAEKLFVSDEYFHENNSQINLKFYPSNFMYNVWNFADTTHNIMINVAKIEDSYYEYALNAAKVQASNDNPLVEPITPYNPVNGGLGLVYGYCVSTDTINVKITHEDVWGYSY